MEPVGDDQGYILCPLEHGQDESSILFGSRENIIRTRRTLTYLHGNTVEWHSGRNWLRSLHRCYTILASNGVRVGFGANPERYLLLVHHLIRLEKHLPAGFNIFWNLSDPWTSLRQDNDGQISSDVGLCLLGLQPTVP